MQVVSFYSLSFLHNINNLHCDLRKYILGHELFRNHVSVIVAWRTPHGVKQFCTSHYSIFTVILLYGANFVLFLFHIDSCETQNNKAPAAFYLRNSLHLSRGILVHQTAVHLVFSHSNLTYSSLVACNISSFSFPDKRVPLQYEMIDFVTEILIQNEFFGQLVELFCSMSADKFVNILYKPARAICCSFK